MCGSLMCWYVMGPQHMDIDYKLAVIKMAGTLSLFANIVMLLFATAVVQLRYFIPQGGKKRSLYVRGPFDFLIF